MLLTKFKEIWETHQLYIPDFEFRPRRGSAAPPLLILCSPASKKYMYCDNQHSSCILFLAAIMLEELFSQELLVSLSVH